MKKGKKFRHPPNEGYIHMVHGHDGEPYIELVDEDFGRRPWLTRGMLEAVLSEDWELVPRIGDLMVIPPPQCAYCHKAIPADSPLYNFCSKSCYRDFHERENPKAYERRHGKKNNGYGAQP